jgi:hypothetical protein
MNPPTPRLVLSDLHPSAKLTLTLFLAMVGSGYLFALGNLYHRHALADGVEGLTIDDLRVTFQGMEAPESATTSDAPAAAKSRMGEMIEPGGDMRKHLTKGGAPDIRALEAWLNRGAIEAEFTKKSLVEEGDRSAEDIIARHCLRCHNVEDGEKPDTPYGPDLFTVDYKMVNVYAAPGTAKEADQPTGEDDDAPKRIGPQAISHLFLITHIHMLSIPVFTLIVSALFLLTGVRPTIKAIAGPIPMIALVCDFASWWLARDYGLFLYVILIAAPVFGASFGYQLLAVVWDIWTGSSRRPEKSPNH